MSCLEQVFMTGLITRAYALDVDVPKELSISRGHPDSFLANFMKP